MDLAALKLKVHQKCLHLALTKIESLKSELMALQEASNQDTKSSAGDKYETGRSMIMLEKEKLGVQLMEAYKLKKALDLIDVKKKFLRAELGALIQSGGQYYYLSTNFGLLTIDGHDIFSLSALSPIGQAMLGKTVGDPYDFRGQKFSIENIA